MVLLLMDFFNKVKLLILNFLDNLQSDDINNNDDDR